MFLSCGFANVFAILFRLFAKLLLKLARFLVGPKILLSFRGILSSIVTSLFEILNCLGLLPFSGSFIVKIARAQVIEQTLKRFKGKVVLVYGDLCLGQDNEMKKVSEEYGVVKVDAVNCIDCQLGGKGRFLEADPEDNLMFMGPGMIGFFKYAREQMLREGVDEVAFANMFSGIKGVVLLDTCGDAEKCKEELNKSGINLKVLETRKIDLENFSRVISDAIEQEYRIN